MVDAVLLLSALGKKSQCNIVFSRPDKDSIEE